MQRLHLPCPFDNFPPSLSFKTHSTLLPFYEASPIMFIPTLKVFGGFLLPAGGHNTSSQLLLCTLPTAPQKPSVPFHMLFPDLEFPQLPSHRRTPANAFPSFKTYMTHHACDAIFPVVFPPLSLPLAHSLSVSFLFSLPSFLSSFVLNKQISVSHDTLSDSLCWY